MARLIDADAFFNDFPEMRDYEYASQEYEVDVEPVKHGMWINISISANEYEPSSAQCNLCGARVYNNFSSVINYCPNCGAKMGEVTDETN